MPRYALNQAPAEAFGHPNECTEPADGTLVDDIPIQYNNTSLASKSTAILDFPSHGHDTTELGDCTQYETHEITVENASPSVSYNGSPLVVVETNVATDPTTGGDVDIVNSGGNSAVSE